MFNIADWENVHIGPSPDSADRIGTSLIMTFLQKRRKDWRHN